MLQPHLPPSPRGLEWQQHQCHKRRARRARAAAADRGARGPTGPGPVSRQAPAYDPSNSDHVLLGNVLGFDAEGSGLWDDSSYFEGDFSSAYEDIHGERIDLEYLIFLQCEGLPYYGKGGAPHDSRSHWAAFESSCEPFHGPRD